MEDHCGGASEQFPWTADETVAAKEKEAMRDVRWRMPISFPTPHSLQPSGTETCTDAESGSWIYLRETSAFSK